MFLLNFFVAVILVVRFLFLSFRRPKQNKKLFPPTFFIKKFLFRLMTLCELFQLFFHHSSRPGCLVFSPLLGEKKPKEKHIALIRRNLTGKKLPEIGKGESPTKN